MDSLISAFASALVAAMATDTWERAKNAAVDLWRRVWSRKVQDATSELENLRNAVLAAGDSGQTDVTQALERVWAGRLQELLLDAPDVAPAVRKVLEDTLIPMLGPSDRSRISQILMLSVSRDASTFNQIMGDQHNVYRLPRLPPSVGCTLPTRTAAFTGRSEQIQKIATISAAAAADAGRVGAIHAIDGMPGVGKTALAVHVGHMMASQFPDRQLFIDLHAHTPGREPADPADALATLLTADGVDARYLPDDLDGRAAMWRDRMSRKRILLILDNAASTEQVIPLLPGAARSVVLVTSRRYLGDLSATLGSVQLDTLPPGDASTMFIRLAGRAESELEKVAEMASLCGYLPLAISLLASVFAGHPSWAMDDLITETRAKLLSVTAENRTVAAAFKLSYQYLSAQQQRFFCHLGLNPGPDITAHAASALADVPHDRTAVLLDELYRNRLIAEHLPGRYQMHNLIHEYARSLSAAHDFADDYE